MSLATLKRAAELLERARDIIEYHVPPCEAKFLWMRDLMDFDQGKGITDVR